MFQIIILDSKKIKNQKYIDVFDTPCTCVDSLSEACLIFGVAYKKF